MTNPSKRSFLANLGRYFDIAGAIIITICILLIIHYGIKINQFDNGLEKNDNNPIVQTKYSEWRTVTNDAAIDSTLIALTKTDLTLLDSIQNLNREIIEIKAESINSESQIKVIATVVSLVFLIVGFFGFKSLNDAREQSIAKSVGLASDIAKKAAESKAGDVAKEVAENIARTYATDEARKVARTTAQHQAEEVAVNAIRHIENDLNMRREAYVSDLDSLRRRLEWLEQNIGNPYQSIQDDTTELSNRRNTFTEEDSDDSSRK